jgi:hypothetical protein
MRLSGECAFAQHFKLYRTPRNKGTRAHYARCDPIYLFLPWFDHDGPNPTQSVIKTKPVCLLMYYVLLHYCAVLLIRRYNS